jgi:hypothetical protein
VLRFLWDKNHPFFLVTSSTWMRLGFSMRVCSFLSFGLSHIYINDRLPPDRGLTDKKQSGIKGRKVRLTYAFTSNASGSEKLPPFVIGKANKPRAFQKKSGKQLGFYYRNNAKAWMTSQLNQEWLQNWDQELVVKNRKILLLQDNFSGHIVPDSLQNIRVENFSPNLTAHVQPMDQGIIRCFKAHYRAKYIQRAIDRYDRGVTPSEIYDIDQLEAMRLADAAWREVDATTIRHCWLKATIVPNAPSLPTADPIIPISSLLNTDSTHHENPIAVAKKEVEAALDELMSTGALQKDNRMDLESLLNPVDESQIMTETSDEEICEAVLCAQKAWEEILINGRDDIDDDAPTDPCPTCHQVLQAAVVINRYVDSLDSAFARELEAKLASFRRQIRLEESHNLTSTRVTDYFFRE